MTCKHSNPAGYVFCASCGEPLAHVRCRCGFVCAVNDLYCGQCGNRLAEARPLSDKSAVAGVDADNRFDLERMVVLAAEENKYLETYKAYVTQEDIRKLLAKRRKKT